MPSSPRQPQHCCDHPLRPRLTQLCAPAPLASLMSAHPAHAAAHPAVPPPPSARLGSLLPGGAVVEPRKVGVANTSTRHHSPNRRLLTTRHACGKPPTCGGCWEVTFAPEQNSPPCRAETLALSPSPSPSESARPLPLCSVINVLQRNPLPQMLETLFCFVFQRKAIFLTNIIFNELSSINF